MKTYSYTCNADTSNRNYGKNVLAVSAAQWQRTEGTIEDFVSWSYLKGRTLSYSIFDMSPLAPEEKSVRTPHRWRGSSLIVIDIDKVEGYSLQDVRDIPFVQEYAAAVYPSSSYAPDTLKLHIVFTLSQPVIDAEQYDQIFLWAESHFPFKIDHATRTPIQPIYGTVFSRIEMAEHVKSLDDGLCTIYADAKEINVPAALAERISSGEYRPGAAPDAKPFHLSDDEAVSKRALLHELATPDKRLSVTLEALRFALKGWGETDGRDERLPLIFSAFAGSSDSAVREMFLDHSAAAWDASNQKKGLPTWWANHRPKDKGYTVATLFRLARLNGWLQRSTVELSSFETIHVKEVGDWLTTADLPSRLLLKSGTGTGKTGGAIKLLKKLGDVKALFIAPSIKLCVALSHRLTSQGVENTLYIDSGRTKDAETLREARVLVTTLQTFGVKLQSSGVSLKDYGLVVMDESDELISSFVRSGIGGGLGIPSHVNREQARFGIDSLAAIFKDAQRVLMLDGTATDLSRFVIESLSPKGSVGVYNNTFRRDKASVQLYTTLAGLRSDIVNTVATGAKVVVAADTKAEAALIETLLILCEVVEPENVLRITSETASDGRVAEFFQDIEAGAQKYQVIIYNSAMGSGVSIEQTKPDVVYLIASYLQPRKLLQMLNRYRQQEVVRAYVTPTETLYSSTVDERYERLQLAAQNESLLAGLNLQKRSEIAEVVAQAALIAATDDYDQSRSVRDFFTRLLYDDGRQVSIVVTGKEELQDEVSQVRDILKERRADVMEDWRSVPPIERGQTLPKNLSSAEIAKGILHGAIKHEFEHYTPDAFGLSDADIARLALKFRPFKWTIDRWLKPERIMNNTLDELYNKRRETVTFRLYFSRVEIISLLGELFPDMNAGYDDEEIAPHAPRFVREVGRRKAVYDMVASDHLSYENVVSRYEGDETQVALALAGGILKSVGLSLKRINGKRHADGTRDRKTTIKGLDDLYTYLALRGGFEQSHQQPIIAFNRETFKAAADRAKEASNQFSILSAEEQREIVSTLNVVDGMTFGSAMSSYAGMQFSA